MKRAAGLVAMVRQGRADPPRKRVEVAPIHFEGGGMQSDDLGLLLGTRDGSLQSAPLRAQLGHAVADIAAVDVAFRDGCNDPIHLALRIGEAALDPAPLPRRRVLRLAPLCIEGIHIGSHQIGGGKLLLEPNHDGPLDRIKRDAALHGAGSAFLGSAALDQSVAALRSGDDHACSAMPAAHQSGQEPFRANLGKREPNRAGLPRINGRGEIGRHDAQGRDLLPLP